MLSSRGDPGGVLDGTPPREGRVMGDVDSGRRGYHGGGQQQGEEGGGSGKGGRQWLAMGVGEEEGKGWLARGVFDFFKKFNLIWASL